MLKVENTEIFGWEAAIRGCRNALNSWSKSDSWFYDENVEGNIYGHTIAIDLDGFPTRQDTDLTELPEEIQSKYQRYPLCIIGPNDCKLMTNLCKGGSEESKWRRFVHVTCDITAPLYFYKELDTYRAGVEKNSCSTMHKIHAKEFTKDGFSCEHLMSSEEHINDCELSNGSVVGDFDKALDVTIMALNDARTLYLQTKEKCFWYQMIQLLPSSYNQRRTYEFNYESLANIYRQRKNHKLDCWRDFCSFIEHLPYSEFITLGN